MNADFPRIITLLRKERAISQKQAASDLNISQALLSHYEKGIRECGLEFLVRTADYYNVSCDYLLGRSPEPGGNTISYDDIPDHDPNVRGNVPPDGIMAAFNKKLIINAVNVLFSLVQNVKSGALVKETSMYLMLAVYKMFRVMHSSNVKNDANFFTVSEVTAPGISSAAMSACEAGAAAAAKEAEGENPETLVTAHLLSEKYPAYASSLLNTIKNSEARMQMIANSEK